MFYNRVLTLLFGLFLLVNLTQGTCCPRCGWGDVSVAGSCPNGDFCDPGYCCATGPCNIFCCNCDGNCRGGDSDFQASELKKKRDLRFEVILHEPAIEKTEHWTNKFNSVDTNGDGNITFIEWAIHSAKVSHKPIDFHKLAKRWAMFDIEGKGYLNEKEAWHRRA